MRCPADPRSCAETSQRSPNIHSVAAVLLQALRHTDGGLVGGELYEAFIAALSARPRGRWPALGAAAAADALSPLSAEADGGSRTRLYVLRILLEKLPEENVKCLRHAARRALAGRPGRAAELSRCQPPLRPLTLLPAQDDSAPAGRAGGPGPCRS